MKNHLKVKKALKKKRRKWKKRKRERTKLSTLVKEREEGFKAIQELAILIL